MKPIRLTAIALASLVLACTQDPVGPPPRIMALPRALTVQEQQLIQALEKTRRLIAGLMGAVGRAGNTYARKLVGRLSPEVIQDLAKMEKKWAESVEQASWRAYERLAKEHLSEPAIENGIQEAMVKVAEDLMTGRAGR